MNATASKTACKRCGRAVLGGEGNPDARIMRRARKGMCVDCVVIVFLQRLENMYSNLLPSGRTWAEALRLPDVQKQFAAVMRVGNADAVPDEIEWERVIELWNSAPHATGLPDR